MAANFQLRLLGPVEATRDGQVVHGFESRKALALLGYLAVLGQAISRSQLADLFWGDKPEALGRANLSRVLHNLSTLLPASLRSDHHTLEFHPGPDYWLDITAFEKLVGQGDVDSLSSAMRLYRDELMAGIYLDDCPDFEIWLVAERERWRQRVADVLKLLVAHHSGRREYDDALRLATRLLALEPWREEAHRQMMLLLARTGQRSAALMQYDTTRRILSEELSVEPSAETTTLYESIRKGEIEIEPASAKEPLSLRSPGTTLHNFPAQFTSFVGRDKEVSEITERLANPGCRLLTLVGAGGVGKTRLAVEAVAKCTDSFPNGIYFVPLSAITSPQFLVSALMDALKFSPASVDPPPVQLLNYLREKKLLLVLDSFEHLLDVREGYSAELQPRHRSLGGLQAPSVSRDTETVATSRDGASHLGMLPDVPNVPDVARSDLLNEILHEAPSVKIVVTSRERLNLRAEWLLYVEGLPYPRLDEKKAVEDYTTVQLFVDRARNVDSHFSLDQDSTVAVIRICQLVEGMPLALELAAAWVDKFSCNYIAREIERNLDFLTTSMRDIPARHRSLRAAIDWSYNLLNPPERAWLRRVSVFVGGFTLRAAETVCNFDVRLREAEGEVPPNVLTILSSLADKSLLTSLGQDSAEPRFGMLELIREYAHQRLYESGESDILQQRHAEFFLALVEQAEPKLRSAERNLWLKRLEIEYDNFRAALMWSLQSESRVQIGLRLAAALIWYWYFRNYLAEGREWVEKELAVSAASGVTSARARVLYGAGAGAWLQADYATAGAFLGESVEIARRLGDQQTLAYALTFLGLLKMNQGDYDTARSIQEESGKLFRALSDRWGLALSLTDLELVASIQGDDAQARLAVEEAQIIFRELNDGWALALALNSLGLEAYRQGDYPTARAHFEEALAIRREVGDKWLIAQSLNYLADVLLHQNDYPAARAYFQESLTLNRELGNKHDLAECLAGFAKLAGATQAAERAARLFGAAESLRQVLGSPLPLTDRAEYDHSLSTVRAQLDSSTWSKAWTEGQRMSLEQALALALEPTASS